MSLPGPSRRFQHAPGTQCYQRRQSSSGTGPGVGRNTIEPGTSSAGSTMP